MTNGIALGIGGAVLLVIAASLAFGWGPEVAVARRLVELVDWLAFWR